MLVRLIDVVVISFYWHIKIRTTRLLGESVSKYLHANKASGEKLWQTQKLGGMKTVWLTVLWGSFDFTV